MALPRRAASFMIVLLLFSVPTLRLMYGSGTMVAAPNSPRPTATAVTAVGAGGVKTALSFAASATDGATTAAGQATKPAKTNPPSQQEPTTVPADRRGVYENPYEPLRQSARPCVGDAHTRGRWVKDADWLQPRYPAYGEILGCCQRGADAAAGRVGVVRPETLYRWVPDDCTLLEWSEELFCKALRGRDVMLAGDSLNDHWHASLYYLLGGRKDIYRREGTVAGKKSCQTHAICAKFYPRPLRLYFLTNQLLSHLSGRNRNKKWAKHIRPYPVLILNSGSWMRDPLDEEREVTDAEWRRLMEGALGLVRQQQYNGTVIWRTTYSGHPFCWTYTEPLREELRPEEFPVVPPYKRYRWAAIPGRNAFSTPLWRNAGAHVLDITRPTNLMPLGHLGRNHPKFALRNTTDCLHYCSPGAVYDTWSVLLMNLLAGNIVDRPAAATAENAAPTPNEARDDEAKGSAAASQGSGSAARNH